MPSSLDHILLSKDYILLYVPTSQPQHYMWLYDKPKTPSHDLSKFTPPHMSWNLMHSTILQSTVPVWFCFVTFYTLTLPWNTDRFYNTQENLLVILHHHLLKLIVFDHCSVQYFVTTSILLSTPIYWTKRTCLIS